MHSPFRKILRMVPGAALMCLLSVSCASPETEEDRLNKAPTEFASPETETAFRALPGISQMRGIDALSWESAARRKDPDGKEFEVVWQFICRNPDSCSVKQTAAGKPGAELVYENGVLKYRSAPECEWKEDKAAAAVLGCTLALLFDPEKAAVRIAADPETANAFLLKLRPKYLSPSASAGVFRGDEIRLVFADDGTISRKEELFSGRIIRITEYSDFRTVGGKRFPGRIHSGTKKAKESREIRNIKVNEPGAVPVRLKDIAEK